jgi:hypothetical protein
MTRMFGFLVIAFTLSGIVFSPPFLLGFLCGCLLSLLSLQGLK